MKKILLYSLGALLLVASCTKNENPKLPNLAQVPPPLFTKDASGDLTISAQTPDDFKGKFKVGLFYPNAAKPQKYDIVVEKDGDVTKVKTLLANVTTFPTTVTVTGVQLKALFGDIVVGNSFTIGADITTSDGKVYPAFPASGAAAFPDADIAQIPGFVPAITYTAVCKFNMADYGAVGTTTPYKVVTNDWYGPDGLGIPGPATIPVTIIDATHLSYKFGANGADVIVAVNPIDNSVSTAKTNIGDYGAVLPYGAVTIVDGGGSVAPCDLTITVNPEYTVSLGSFGNYKLVIQKP